MLTRYHHAFTVLPLLLSGLCISACSDEEDLALVSVGAVSSDLTTHPLEDDGREVSPSYIKGSYGQGCKVGAGRGWDLMLDDPADRSLEVALNDGVGSCLLVIEKIGMRDQGQSYELAVQPPIPLSLGFAREPSAVVMRDDTVFYANAVFEGLQQPSYTNDFAIRFVYSDDPTIVGETAPPAVYGTVSASADGSVVPSPDYEMSFDELQLVVDAQKAVVSSSSGSVVLRHLTQTAEEWKIFDKGRCCDGYDFGDIDALYTDDAISSNEMTKPDVVLSWEDFELEGDVLPQWRTVVLKHTGAGGVFSYELFQVLFPGPASAQ